MLTTPASTFARVVRLVLAAGLALALTLVAAPASAAFSNQAAWCNSAWVDTAVWLGGCPSGHSLASFDDPDVIAYYGARGFDRNFMIWAPSRSFSSTDIGGREFAGCAEGVAHSGGLCNGALDWATVAEAWGGSTPVKYWGSNPDTMAFIALICGNMSRNGAAGPIPTVYGYKYEDVNGNGRRDTGEGALAGVTIKLWFKGVVVATTTTNANGRYGFSLDTRTVLSGSVKRLTAGTYKVTEAVPAGYRQTSSNPASFSVPYGAANTAFHGGDFGNQKVVDVSIAKSTSTPVTVSGTDATWTLDVTNEGDWPVTDVTVTDDVPAEFAAISSVPTGCEVTGLRLTCRVEEIAPGRAVSFRFTSRLGSSTPADLSLVNAACVEVAEVDVDAGDDCDTATVSSRTEADVGVAKTSDLEYLRGGDQVTWTLTVTNAGPSWARSTVVTDVVPDAFVVDRVDDRCEVVADGRTLTCAVGDLADGESVDLAVTATVLGSAPGASGTDTHEHQMTVVKKEASWDLDAGESDTFTARCDGSDDVLTDVSWGVSSVDQGTGTPASVRSTAVTTAGSSGSVSLTNDATGRAQGHLWLVCASAALGSTDGHTHRLETAPAVTTTADLQPGRSSVVVDMPPNHLPVAPTWALRSGSARQVASELLGSAVAGYSWRLTFEASEESSVTVGATPLHLRTTSTQVDGVEHEHTLRWTHPTTTVSAGPGWTEQQVTCGIGEKGITPTWTSDSGVAGPSPEPVTRRFRVWNDSPAAATAEVGVVCLAVGPAVLPLELVTNTATAATATTDPDPSDDAGARTTVVTLGLDLPQPAGAIAAARQVGRRVVVRASCAEACEADVVVRVAGSANLVRHFSTDQARTRRLVVRVPRGTRARQVVLKVDGDVVRRAVSRS
ncbi:SdrD B-like domain-containing protein [Nocardioides bruguierae]|uniref:SdrD B-like domain-containing protein n=1 Tax=Nocardioides bruguierae TaxID=2945102 RepID=UPI0020208351|nr:SdrD B-like domain-containing protein [Nocardioides bruguierae]MCL8026779.1 hypothetical protein [Nocardioides bruguierae]